MNVVLLAVSALLHRLKRTHVRSHDGHLGRQETLEINQVQSGSVDLDVIYRNNCFVKAGFPL